MVCICVASCATRGSKPPPPAQADYLIVQHRRRVAWRQHELFAFERAYRNLLLLSRAMALWQRRHQRFAQYRRDRQPHRFLGRRRTYEPGVDRTRPQQRDLIFSAPLVQRQFDVGKARAEIANYRRQHGVWRRTRKSNAQLPDLTALCPPRCDCNPLSLRNGAPGFLQRRFSRNGQLDLPLAPLEQLRTQLFFQLFDLL